MVARLVPSADCELASGSDRTSGGVPASLGVLRLAEMLLSALCSSSRGTGPVSLLISSFMHVHFLSTFSCKSKDTSRTGLGTTLMTLIKSHPPSKLISLAVRT